MARLTGTVLTLMLTLACGSSGPTAPTPTPTPPAPTPPTSTAPSLTCGDEVSRATINAGGMAVSYTAPSARDGQSPVTVSCSPESGANFPIGTTAVTCTATDALQRTASCSFNVTVAKLPQLSRTRFLAFGDSITAGEVTVPAGGITSGGFAATKLIVVPTASYPTVLERTLRGRYAAQADAIVVANYGLPGERAAVARSRFLSALSAVRPEAVLLMEGYNDIGGGADGAASTAANEIRLMANEARLQGARVFIATLAPPIPGRQRSISEFFVLDYNNRMRDAASREGAVLVDLYAALLPDVQRYIGVDGLHPNEAGYARIADLFFQSIQANLEVR
jgi:lysophospholipase L1-like esterase